MRRILMGVIQFREQLLPQYEARFRALAEGQAPDALLITCSDSRLLPDVLASVDPGELFVMRNVGNLVPPATVDGASTGDLSEASAIEYSVLALKVRHLIVCGHSQCGAMQAALARKSMAAMPNLARWLHHSAPAVVRLDQEGPLEPAPQPVRPAFTAQRAGPARTPGVVSDRARTDCQWHAPPERLVVRHRPGRDARLPARESEFRADRPQPGGTHAPPPRAGPRRIAGPSATPAG